MARALYVQTSISCMVEAGMGMPLLVNSSEASTYHMFETLHTIVLKTGLAQISWQNNIPGLPLGWTGLEPSTSHLRPDALPLWATPLLSSCTSGNFSCIYCHFHACACGLLEFLYLTFFNLKGQKVGCNIGEYRFMLNFSQVKRGFERSSRIRGRKTLCI